MAEFSNIQLIQFLQKAARRVNRILCLTGTDEEIIIDNAGDITSPTGESDLEDLVLLQAECLVVQRRFMDFLGGDDSAAGVLVRDGEQTVDTRAAGSARANVFTSDSTINPCNEAKEQLRIEKLKRIMSDTGGGKLVY